MTRHALACLLLLAFVFTLVPPAGAAGTRVVSTAADAAEGYKDPDDLTEDEALAISLLDSFGPGVEVELGEDDRPVAVNGYPYRSVEAVFAIRAAAATFVTRTDWMDYPFWRPATTYDGNLAMMSLIMAVCAARALPKGGDPGDFDPAANVEAYLRGAGFTDIRKDDYSKETSLYTISTAIGSRRMEHEGDEPFTLIAVGVCGGGYTNEWQSNITIGSDDLHEGFRSASDLVIDRIAGYIATHGIKGRIKLWMSGYSRAAAVVNLTAGRLTQPGTFPEEDVFAYTFATPAGVLNPPETGHDNIFNILCPTDVVPQVLPAEWGYGRYGKDLWIPVQEFSVIGEAVAMARAGVIKDVFGIDIHYSAALNLRMRMLFSMLLEMFGNRGEYVSNVQDTAVRVMQQTNNTSFLLSTMQNLLLGARENDREGRGKLDALLNYVFRVFGNAITRTELAAVNHNSGSEMYLLFTEHREDSYLSSLKVIHYNLFEDTTDFSYIMVKGPVDLSLTTEAMPGWRMTLTKSGAVLEQGLDGAETEVDPEFQEFYMERIGDVSVAAIPDGLNIQAQWTAVSGGTVEVLQARCGVHASALYPGTGTDPAAVAAGDTAAFRPWAGEGAPLPEGFREKTWRAADLTGFLGISAPLVSWRIVVALLLLLIGLVIFLVIRLIAFFMPNKARKGPAFWILMAVFCVAVVEAEGSFWLLADMPWVRFVWKAVTGASVLAVYFLVRRKREKLQDGLFPGLAAAVAADLVVTWASLPGVALYLLAHGLLIACFLRKQSLRPVQWIQWGLLSLLASVLIVFMFVPRMGINAWTAAIYAPVLILMVYSTSEQPSRIRLAAAFFLISDFLLGAFLAVWPEPLAHILCMALFTSSLMLMASHRGGLVPGRARKNPADRPCPV